VCRSPPPRYNRVRSLLHGSEECQLHVLLLAPRLLAEHASPGLGGGQPVLALVRPWWHCGGIHRWHAYRLRLKKVANCCGLDIARGAPDHCVWVGRKVPNGGGRNFGGGRLDARWSRKPHFIRVRGGNRGGGGSIGKEREDAKRTCIAR